MVFKLANHKCYSVDSLELSKQYRIPCTTLWRSKHELQPTVDRTTANTQEKDANKLQMCNFTVKNVSKYALSKRNYPKTIKDLIKAYKSIYL